MLKKSKSVNGSVNYVELMEVYRFPPNIYPSLVMRLSVSVDLKQQYCIAETWLWNN